MKKNIWRFLFFLQAFLILIVVILSLYINTPSPKATPANMSSLLDQTRGGLQPEKGFIPDAKTAADVGSIIIDSFFSGKFNAFSSTTVEYDAAERLWMIKKGYLFHPGATVVLDQDTGEVVYAVLWKN